MSPAPGLPPGGFASPMGYWLAAAAEPGLLARELLTISVSPTAPEAGDSDFSRPGGRPSQTVRIKGIHPGDGDLSLTIGPAGAQVVASDASWQALAEPCLLAICQYFRFCAIDAEIDRLTEQARADLAHATMPSTRTLLHRRHLTARAEAVRSLLVDLPYFEGVLTDPLPFCTSERSAQVYQSLSEKLHLADWCESLDDRIEPVEDTYRTIAEKLCEYRNFAWEAILEALILAILLGDLILMVIEFFRA